MSGPLLIAPVVEGHGDEIAVPVLIRRLGAELEPPIPLDVLKPIRTSRAKMAKPDELGRAVQLAALKLRERRATAERALVLVLADADDDPACELGPRWLAEARREDLDVSVVLADPEFETWFVAASPSLGEFLDLGDRPAPEAPEPERRARSGSRTASAAATARRSISHAWPVPWTSLCAAATARRSTSSVASSKPDAPTREPIPPEA